MSSQATILYPNNTLQIPLNVKDRVEVSYNAPWPSVNLTLLCRAATSRTYAFYNIPDNPLPPNGTYLAVEIDEMDFGITAYPADCVFRLTKYESNSINADGGTFSLTSADAAPRTFAITSTVGLVTTATTTSAATSTSAPSQIVPADTPQPSAPGRGTSAAIGIGVVLGVLIVVTLVGIWARFLRKRQKQQADKIVFLESLAQTKPELDTVLASPSQTSWQGRHSSPLAKEAHGHHVAEADGSPASLPRSELPASLSGRSDSKRYELA